MCLLLIAEDDVGNSSRRIHKVKLVGNLPTTAFFRTLSEQRNPNEKAHVILTVVETAQK